MQESPEDWVLTVGFIEREVALGAGTGSECQEDEISFSYSLKL